MRNTPRSAIILGGLTLAFGLTACAPKVTREDFESEVGKIREEMQTGDRQLATRIDSVENRLTTLEQELQSFRSEYNVSVERMEGALKFNVPVHFEFGSAELREADRPVLERFAGVVKEHYPNATITVEGFADPAGSAAFNQRLGMRRAEAVAGYLSGQGALDASFIRAVSYGEARNRQIVPGAQGPGEQGVENRRVALVIDYASQTSATEDVSLQ
ncbi:MAG TPA: OmpA family protein [Gemmatimonadales bacterium]